MMGEPPDLERLRSFLARHRQSDGGYRSTLGGAADLGGTYSCSIMLHWARRLGKVSHRSSNTVGFVLFGGRALDGWEGDKSLWAAKDGKIVGTLIGAEPQRISLRPRPNTATTSFNWSFRLRGDDSSNSGVQVRSVRIPGTEMRGYQADIGQGYWGCLYDESRRNKVLAPASERALAAIHKNAWNHYSIRCMGGRRSTPPRSTASNSVTYNEPDAAIERDRRDRCFESHAGKPMTIEFKDILIQPLPSPKSDSESTPGFHLRTVKTPAGERKYSVLPSRPATTPEEGYPGGSVPLHGSDEPRHGRGDFAHRLAWERRSRNTPRISRRSRFFPRPRRPGTPTPTTPALPSRHLTKSSKRTRSTRTGSSSRVCRWAGRGRGRSPQPIPGQFSAIVARSVDAAGPSHRERSKDMPTWVVVRHRGRRSDRPQRPGDGQGVEGCRRLGPVDGIPGCRPQQLGPGV